MFTKVYDKVKEYIKENKLFFATIIIILILSVIELPYYINSTGGLVNLDKKVEIENEYKSEGSLNMAYVTEYKPSILMLMYALINPNCDIYKAEEYVMENDTKEDMLYREQLQMKEAVDSAIILGYSKAGKDARINKTDLYVTYILKEANTDLKVKDKLVKVNNIPIKDRSSLVEYVTKQEEGTKLDFEVENDKKTYHRYAIVTAIEGHKLIGVTLTSDSDYTLNPKLNFKFKQNEAGPSGGLMTSLDIYNELLSEDITKGYKIAGTGTIDIDGTVGSIGGVKYKLRGAAKKKADIFFVPAGDNYDEAVKEQEKHKYKIKIVSVSSFDEALKYLSEIEHK